MGPALSTEKQSQQTESEKDNVTKLTEDDSFINVKNERNAQNKDNENDYDIFTSDDDDVLILDEPDVKSSKRNDQVIVLDDTDTMSKSTEILDKSNDENLIKNLTEKVPILVDNTELICSDDDMADEIDNDDPLKIVNDKIVLNESVQSVENLKKSNISDHEVIVNEQNNCETSQKNLEENTSSSDNINPPIFDKEPISKENEFDDIDSDETTILDDSVPLEVNNKIPSTEDISLSPSPPIIEQKPNSILKQSLIAPPSAVKHKYDSDNTEKNTDILLTKSRRISLNDVMIIEKPKNNIIEIINLDDDDDEEETNEVNEIKTTNISENNFNENDEIMDIDEIFNTELDENVSETIKNEDNSKLIKPETSVLKTVEEEVKNEIDTNLYEENTLNEQNKNVEIVSKDEIIEKNTILIDNENKILSIEKNENVSVSIEISIENNENLDISTQENEKSYLLENENIITTKISIGNNENLDISTQENEKSSLLENENIITTKISIENNENLDISTQENEKSSLLENENIITTMAENENTAENMLSNNKETDNINEIENISIDKNKNEKSLLENNKTDEETKTTSLTDINDDNIKYKDVNVPISEKKIDIHIEEQNNEDVANNKTAKEYIDMDEINNSKLKEDISCNEFIDIIDLKIDSIKNIKIKSNTEETKENYETPIILNENVSKLAQQISVDISDDDEQSVITTHPNEKLNEQNTNLKDSIEIITIDDLDDSSVDVQQTENIETKINEKNDSKINEKIETNSVITETKIENNETQKEEEIICKLDNTPIKNQETVKKPKDELHDCINFFCLKQSSEYYLAPNFILSHFGIKKKVKKTQFICCKCFDEAINKYEELCGALEDHKPLLEQDLPVQAELVEISDSSEDEEAESIIMDDQQQFLSLEDLAVLEENLEKILPETLKRISIGNQIKSNKEILRKAYEKHDVDLEKLDTEINKLQKIADKMHFTLYNSQDSYTIKRVPAVNLDSASIEFTEPFELPGDGKLQRPLIKIYDDYLAPHKLNVAWTPCKVTDITVTWSNEGVKTLNYKVQFKRQNGIVTKYVTGKNLAYAKPSTERYPIGCRVIASFLADTEKKVDKSLNITRNHYFPGIIAEPIQPNTNFRYLIFFDDGYTSYISHEDIRLVNDSSKNVWEDVLESSREFIQEYLMENHQRAMVQVKKGHRLIAEYKGSWLSAKVHDVDCSLVQLYFEDDKRYEWIYRGSRRLAPLFREKQNSKQATGTQFLKRNEPYIEYITVNDDYNSKETTFNADYNNSDNLNQKQPKPPLLSVTPVQVIPKRSVAKKSTVNLPNTSSNINAPRPPSIVSLNRNTIVIDEKTQPGKITYFTVKKPRPPLKYRMHICSPRCLYHINDNLKPYSPLAKPLLSGWERQILRSKTKKVIVYKGPCGKRMRNMYELHKYLQLTKCTLNVECFDFDVSIYCLAEWVVDKQFFRTLDLSDGLEKMPISCINCFDDSLPPPCIYSERRVPTEGVNLNLDEDFLCGCDCTDDCLDKTKCQCWQLTIAGAKLKNANIPIDEIGYEFKRLLEPVPTGIYECNSRCKCTKRCINRVVQHPLNIKLQVFKTNNRGWGLRTINDIPRGGFICIYAGHLLTEQKANEGGATDGDEYFAELDYIEVVERLKEGYESDCADDLEEDSDEFEPEQKKINTNDDSDEDFTANLSLRTKKKTMNTRSSTRRVSKTDYDLQKNISDIKLNEDIEDKNKDNIMDDCITISDDEDVRVPLNFLPDSSLLDMDSSLRDDVPSKYKSVRKMYGKYEYSYIMDAKKSGNIGRYFNHSCQPNLFVQNVFVDTHDLRFPWVAFFASESIRAGSELTWNYNYDVGSVPGKVLYCECGATNCRGRLL